jgi:membrane associated rhomboid family serine protease
VIIPYGTDAPVYHWPVGTVVLIALNVIAFISWGSGVIPPDVIKGFMLQFDGGLHPIQWISSTFIHVYLLYLIEHMAFLWIFGLIVEGKLGWWKFLACYFGLGIEVGACEQLFSIVFHQKGMAFGNSGVIFGLLGMAMIWAPQNEVRLIWLILRGGALTISIRGLALSYFAVEGGFAALNLTAGLGITSGLLHCLGLVAGVPLAIVLLKKGVVDCGGWDIFSLRQGRPKTIKMYRPGRLHGAELEESMKSALDLMREYLQERDPAMAAAVYRQSVAEAGAWMLPMDVLNSLIDAFAASGSLSEAKPFIEEAIARDPQNAVDRTLLLARAFIEGDRDPVKGLEVLFSLPDGLSGPREAAKDRLLEEASRIEAEHPGPSSIAS